MVKTGKALYDSFQAAMEQMSPRPVEAALVSFDGLLYARYPINPNEVWHEERDKLSPLSVAILSLSERICKEVQTGEWNESIIRGTAGIIITIGIDDKMVLSARFPTVPSIDDLRSQLRTAIVAINYQNPRDIVLKTAVEQLSPRPKMATIIRVDGLRYAIYPVNEGAYGELHREETRIAEISTAMLSLSESMSNELRNGDLRHTIVRGTDGITMTMAIGRDAVLVATFTSIPSLEDMRLQLLKLTDDLKPILPSA